MPTHSSSSTLSATAGSVDPSSRGEPSKGSNLDDLRRRNLATVLQFVHLHDGCSRAEITRTTGLNRSTVRSLIAELARLGIVSEGPAAKIGSVGRPSPRVYVTDRYKVLAVNPEIDATEGALVGLGGHVFARATVPHDHVPSPEEVTDAIMELRRQLAGEQELLGVGVALPGLVDKQTGHIVMAPHLGWRDVPLGSSLSRALDLPVVVDNDANCGVVAESLFGAGAEQETVVYLNGGASGIGGAIVAGGTLMGGSQGYGGEFGHTPVNTVGHQCDCGAQGCFESEVSRSQLLAALGPVEPEGLAEALVELCSVSQPTPEQDRALAEVDRQLHFVGVALRTVVNVINPDRIVLGGFLAAMTKARGLDSLEQALSQALPGSRDNVEVVSTRLGGDILTIGAGQLVLDGMIANPLEVATEDREVS